MHSCKNIKFIRWGTLSQKKGKVISTDNFHKAPADFGLYAFPQFLSESFLVDWKYSDKNDQIRLSYINKEFDKNYKNINDFYDDESIGLTLDKKLEYTDSIPSFLKKIKNKDYKIFSYKGRIWHHFINESKSPIRKGSWALDNYDDYIKILNKVLLNIAKDWNNRNNKNIGQFNSKYVVLRYYAKDEFEVYLIDKIK